MIYKGKTNEIFEVVNDFKNKSNKLKNNEVCRISLLWFKSDNNQLIVDNQPYTFNTNDVVCFTEFHNVEIVYLNKARFLRWSKEFYCIIDHDSEVSCKGVLFYGAPKLPVFNVKDQDLEILDTVWNMLLREMVSNDNLQEEMLRMMLKRILILCTRIYKNQ